MNDIQSQPAIQNSNQMPNTPIMQIPKWRQLLDKGKPIAKELFDKFYSNKKIFWPITIFFTIVFLIIVLGILFGNKNGGKKNTKNPTPTPFVAVPSSTPDENSPFYAFYLNLGKLKDKVLNLDVKQTRLQPPLINFDIKF